MKPSLDNIPRGNTCRGVNRAVIEYLISKKLDLAGRTILDVPCGNGEFLSAAQCFFPEARTIGADIVEPQDFRHEFHKFDASSDESLGDVRDCAVVTSISGVMEFDNTLAFFRTIAAATTDDVTMIVTNDNLLKVRDRILYFLFGRFGQYRSTVASDGPTWKILHLGNLVRCLNDAGFNVRETRYVAPKWPEWLWLPLAAPMYLIQLLYHLTNERERIEEYRKYFPFRSMLANHYLLICGKKRDPAISDDPADSKRIDRLRAISTLPIAFLVLRKFLKK